MEEGFPPPQKLRHVKWKKQKLPNVTQQISIQMLDRINMSNEWWFCNQHYTKEQMNKVFGLMEVCEAQHLILWQNIDPNIFYHIISPQFPFLTQIQLASNKISNIQALTFMKAPNLVSVDLSDNYIRKIQPLLKIVSRNFCQFFLKNNCVQDIQQIEKLSRMWIAKKCDTIESIILDEHRTTNPRNQILCQRQIEDISSLIKLNPRHQNYLGIMNEGRIRQQHVLQCFKRKYTAVANGEVPVDHRPFFISQA